MKARCSQLEYLLKVIARLEALKDTYPGKETSEGFSCHNHMDAEVKSRSRQVLLDRGGRRKVCSHVDADRKDSCH